MGSVIRSNAALALLLCMAGCATYETSGPPTAVVSPDDAKVIAASRAKNAIVLGKSTRTDVLAALGETLSITFDSGYEVWVYRVAADGTARSAREATGEYVILFAPSGLVTKTRIRPAPAS